jgi:glutamyl-tRNA reductase
MHLCLVGLDHTTAPVALRERLAFSAERLAEALMQLTQERVEQAALFSEAAILSTCNRVEIYGITSGEDATADLAVFLAAFHGLNAAELAPHLFTHSGPEAAAHLCATAAGLHSIVLGESQIQGQVRKALEAAQQAGSAGPALTTLFRQALTAGKRVRSETTLGQGAASVSQAGVELARQRLGDLRGCRVLLVGSGKVSELAAQNLRANGAGELLVLNRTFAHAQQLAERCGARALPFDALPAALAQADIVISSTSAPTPIMSRADVDAALRARGQSTPRQPLNAPMLLLDLAVPRDIAPDVAELAGVELWTVDDLHAVVTTTLEQRRAVVEAAQEIVAVEVEAFTTWLRAQEALPALTNLRRHAEALRAAELERTLRRLQLSPEQQRAIEAFSQSLVNKLLHSPTLRLKHAAAQGEGRQYAALVQELFDLSGEGASS